MIKTILVPLTGYDSDAAALGTAYAVARMFDSHLACCHIQPDPGQLAASLSSLEFGGGVMTEELFQSLREETTLRSEGARKAYDALCASVRITEADAPPGPSSVSAAYVEQKGFPIETTTAEARFRDLTVFGRSPTGSSLPPAAIGSLLLSIGRPLVVAPAQTPANVLRTVAVAWKETAEAARALTAAMPILEKAEKVLVLAAGEGSQAAEDVLESAQALTRQLRWHNAQTEAHYVVSGARGTPEALLETARDAGTDLLVMGGYGHSRVRETVLGGMTQRVLSDCPLPVLLMH